MSVDSEQLRELVLLGVKSNLVAGIFSIPAIEDYIVARWSFINGLDRQFFWSALQCIEKLEKAVLVWSEIETKSYSHRIHSMAEKIAEMDPHKLLNQRFKNLPVEDAPGARNALDFIAHIEKYGSSKTRYRLNSTTVYSDDIVRLDETVFGLATIGKSLDSAPKFGSVLSPFFEHSSFSEAAREALVRGNAYFISSSSKELERRFSFKQSPLPENPSPMQEEAIQWLKKLARV